VRIRRSDFRLISSVVPTGNRPQIRHYSHNLPLGLISKRKNG
jgi:hypothetical protein